MSIYKYSKTLIIPSTENAEVGLRDIALAAKVEITMTKLL